MASALLRKLMAPPVIPSVAPTSSNLMRDAVQGLRPPTPYVRFDMLRLVRRNEVRPAVVACHTAMKLHVRIWGLPGSSGPLYNHFVDLRRPLRHLKTLFRFSSSPSASRYSPVNRWLCAPLLICWHGRRTR